MQKLLEKELFLGTQDELVSKILNQTILKKKRAYFGINADCMLNYWNDAAYKKVLDHLPNILYVDGMGIIYAQKFLKDPIAKERIATTDLFPALVDCLNKQKSDINIFLLGGKEEIAERVKNNFAKKYPYVKILGTQHGYFNKVQESTLIIEKINSLKIDILFVGFGNPLQEKWVYHNFKQLKVTTIITCGGLFDYYSNNVKRAPLIIQKTGFEWLFRLIQEPKRLYKRYLFGNMRYIMRVFRLKLRLR